MKGVFFYSEKETKNHFYGKRQVSHSLSAQYLKLSNQQIKTMPNTKQLLDEVLMISGIIKVEVNVISRAEGRG